MENMKKESCKLNIIGDYNKEKVLLIHGMGFYWENCFKGLIELLKDKYCLLIPELEGHAPDAKGQISSVYCSAEEIIKELSIAKVKRVKCVYGISLGASIALEIALNNKLKINKLILDGGQYESMGENTKKFSEIMSSEFLKIIDGKHMMIGVQKQMGYLKSNDIDVLRPLMYLNISLESLYNAAYAAYCYDIKNRKEQLNIDVLIMCGGNEVYAKRSVKLVQEKSLKQVQTCVFPDKGHAEVLSKEPNEICKLIEG